MSVPGPGSRFLLLAGYDLMPAATCAQVKAFDPPGVTEAIQDTTGPNQIHPCKSPVGFNQLDPLHATLFATSTLLTLFNKLRSEPGSVPHVVRPACWGVNGTSIGSAFSGGSCHDAKYLPKLPVAQLTEVDIELEFTGGLDTGGVILHSNDTARTADGNTQASSQDNAASSATGGRGYIHCTALTLDTATGLAVKIQDSSDNAAWTDLITFTTITAAPAAEVKVLSSATATVKRYLSAIWDLTGTVGASTTTNFFVGFGRGQ